MAMAMATETATAGGAQARPGQTRVGWIGTGVMGASMCGHVLRAGYAATVHSRTRTRAVPLLDAGARWGETPRTVAAESDVVFSMVGYPRDVRDVILGESGVLAGARPGTIVVDMTTSEPSLAAQIHRAARERQVDCLDAPVSGGDVGAREARLAIMVGGDAAVLERVRPLLECMGKTIVHQGPAGSGQHTKMVNQILIATGMIGVCEALLYGHRAGLDLEAVMKAVSGGAAGSWSLSNYGPRILARKFDPGFLVEHFIKDMKIALDEADRLNLALPGLALAQQLYQALRAQGHGKKGTHSLMLALAHLSAVTWA
jgi:3-hydroxyisobutyrate dehydrogenase